MRHDDLLEVRAWNTNLAGIELTLDNFEEMYKGYVLLKRIKGESLRNLPDDFIDDVRSGNVMFRGEAVFTKIKGLKYSVEMATKVGEIINEVCYP